MSQNHSTTKRNRRQVSGKRGHPGQKTQHALRSPEAQIMATLQNMEINSSALRLATEAGMRRLARIAKREGVKK